MKYVYLYMNSRHWFADVTNWIERVEKKLILLSAKLKRSHAAIEQYCI